MRAKIFGQFVSVCLAVLFQIAVAEAAETKASKAPTASVPVAATSDEQPAQPVALEWHDDYAQAMQQAKDEQKLMLVHFYRSSDQKKTNASEAGDSFSSIEKALSNPELQKQTDRFVFVKLPLDATVTVKGKAVRLLDHGAFSELHKGPGVAVVDLADKQADYYGYVVSVLPFTPGKYYRFRPDHLATLVNLPEGTLTQRSMIFAVRIHPEHPASTNGEEDPVLLSEAAGHSDYQAEVQVQGHQGWGSRFQRIIGKLLGRSQQGGAPVEIVAESWPNQDLMDSCVDCVASWRQSEGHWNAVKAQQVSYGYDIREGGNGIWYATGIFRPKQ